MSHATRCRHIGTCVALNPGNAKSANSIEEVQVVTLLVPTKRKTYEFDGPYKSAEDLSAKSAVYVITTKGENSEDIFIDAGESGDIHDRVRNHDRAKQWERYNQHGLYVSARYCKERKRMKIEKRIRKYHDLPCGIR
jgi:hypothetical protein